MNIWIDALVFFGFIACVLFVGFYMGRSKKKPEGEENAEDYFLAGRGLSWWLIGFSLIAANISAEQFVGMSGQGAGLEGLSCASWEWIAAITLVVVAFCFLPYFLKTGITTMPEFLEKRYNHYARTLMTVSMIGILIAASLIGVTYAGAFVMWQMFGNFGFEIAFPTCCIIMSVIAGAYVLFGGLKACAWADLLQGAALIVGGAIIAYIACSALCDAETATNMAGKVVTLSPEMGLGERLRELNDAKLHMGPANEKGMIWTVLIMGIWIPNFYYWGLNQYITQRILGSGSLAEGQKGIVLAAALKLVIPFIIVIPGIIAFNLYATPMAGLQSQEVYKRILVTKDESLTLRGVQPYENHEYIRLSEDVKTGEWKEWVNEKDKKVQKTKSLSPEDLKWIETHNKNVPAAVEKLKKVNPNAKAIGTDVLTYKSDGALGLLMEAVREKCPAGVFGFILAALLGAIVSSLAAVLNATSTLFTMDIFQRYIKPDAKQKTLVTTGRVVTVVLVIVACVAASALNSTSIFNYIQSIQCYVSPGVLAVFAFGMLNRQAARWIGVFGLLFAPVVYFFLSTFGWSCFPEFIRNIMANTFGVEMVLKNGVYEMSHFLIAASWTLCITIFLMFVLGLIFKMPKKMEFESNTTLNMTMSKGALIAGIIVCVATVALYVFFW